MNACSTIVLARPSRRRAVRGVALVITLLMLSVITFLAIAFLAMSRQNKSAVSASLDVATARAASDAAQARAQAEIMAQILTSGDALQYRALNQEVLAELLPRHAGRLAPHVVIGAKYHPHLAPCGLAEHGGRSELREED